MRECLSGIKNKKTGIQDNEPKKDTIKTSITSLKKIQIRKLFLYGTNN